MKNLILNTSEEYELIKEVKVLAKQNDSFLISEMRNKQNVQENLTFVYQNLYEISEEKINLVHQGTETFSNFIIYEAGKSYAKLSFVPDPNNKVKKNTVLEIYKNNQLEFTLNLSVYHEDVINNAIIGGSLKWNQSSSKIIYIAKPKLSEQKNFFQTEDEKQALNFRQYEQNFGEQTNELKDANIYICDLEARSISQVLIEQNILPANVSFDFNDGIIFCGYQIQSEFKYGLQHCFNRKSSIYRIKNPKLLQLWPKKEESEGISELNIISNDEVAFKPFVSVNFKKVVYFGSPMKHQHCFYVSLKLINLEDESISELISIDYENKSLQARVDQKLRNCLFNGIVGYYNDYEKSTWLKDSIHFVFNSILGGQQAIFRINTENKELVRFTHLDEEIKKCSNYIFLKYSQEHDLLFFIRETLLFPQNFGVIINATTNFKLIRQESIPDENFIDEKFYYSGEAESFFWRNNQIEIDDAKRPLVVFFHGGPHGRVQNDFTLLRRILLSQGINILAPNFTGSIGYGQKFLEALSGNIGQVEIKESIDLINQIVAEKLCDKKKIIVLGKSYGGFLSGMMGTRYSEYFKAAIIINPAMNIPFMVYSSDIPEWASSVAFNNQFYWNLNSEQISQLFEMSPMSEKMKLPTLLLLGGKDKRCPIAQSLAFHAQCIFNGCDIKTYIYPESDHNLSDSVETTHDVIVKILLFIQNQTQ